MPTSIVFVVHTDVESLAAMVLYLGVLGLPVRPLLIICRTAYMSISSQDWDSPPTAWPSWCATRATLDPAEDAVAGSGSYAPYLAE
jgi:hypothetical protein